MILLFFCVNGFLRLKASVAHVQSGKNLSGLKLAILQYAQDNGGSLPPMGGLAQFRKAVMPYARSQDLFRAYDDSNRLILPNPRLSGRKASGVKQLTVLLYEATPARVDGLRWVAFLPEQAIPVMFADPDFQGSGAGRCGPVAATEGGQWHPLVQSREPPRLRPNKSLQPTPTAKVSGSSVGCQVGAVVAAELRR